MKPKALEIRPVSKGGIRRAGEQGAELIRGAEQDADLMIREAQRLSSEIRARGYAEGHEEGRREAFSKFIEIEELHRRSVRLQAEVLLDLVVCVASEVLGTALKEQADSLLARIDRALRTVCPSGSLKLFISPDDKEQAANALSAFRLKGVSEICLDGNLSRGSARLEGEVVQISLCLDEHLEALAEALRAQLPVAEQVSR